MRKLMNDVKAQCSHHVIAVAIVMLCGAVLAADYNVTVSSGVTNVVDDAFVSALGSADRLVKRGLGTLKSTPSMSSYAGEIVVEEGVLLVEETGALGTSAGKTTVSNGASIVINSSNANNTKFYGETFQLAGDGAEGIGGAFAHASEGISLTGQNFRYITLLDDARINVRGNLALYAGLLNMNGHTLTLAVRDKNSNGSTTWDPYFNMNRTRIQNPGHIILETGRFCISGRTMSDGTAVWDGDGNNTLTLKSRTKFNFQKSLTKIPWKLIAEEKAGLYVDDDYDSSGSTNNAWGGPVELRGTISINYNTKNGNLNIAGPVTGSGSMYWQNYTTLHLYGTNTFTGGLSATGLPAYGNTPLYLCDGMAMPSAGGDLSLVDANLPLVAANAYSLPCVSISNDTERTVSGAAAGGTMAGLVKTGVGTLVYSADVVVTGRTEILQGALKIGRVLEPRAQVGGILEGERNFDDQTAANNFWYYEATPRDNPAATTAMDSVHYAYTTAQPLWATQPAAVRYEGYIWNDSPTNETWSFMSGCSNRGRMYINGKTIINQDSYQRAAFGQAELHPGANHFVYSIIVFATPTSGGGGSTLTQVIDFDGTKYEDGAAKGLNWVLFKGCAYNRQGKMSYDEADYEKFENLSDGLLMTVTNDLTGLVPRTVGGFSNVVVAAGTTLDISRRDVVLDVDTFSGEGTVTNGILKIGGCWTVRAAELVKGNHLVLKDADLAFSAGAEVDVDDAALLNRTSSPLTIAMSDTAITTLPTVSETLASKRWQIEVGAEGHSVLLRYAPRGFAISFR